MCERCGVHEETVKHEVFECNDPNPKMICSKDSDPEEPEKSAEDKKKRLGEKFELLTE